jgi:hypothetical protein
MHMFNYLSYNNCSHEIASIKYFQAGTQGIGREVNGQSNRPVLYCFGFNSK